MKILVVLVILATTLSTLVFLRDTKCWRLLSVDDILDEMFSSTAHHDEIIRFDGEKIETSTSIVEMPNEFLGLWTDPLPYPFYTTPVDLLFALISVTCMEESCEDLLWKLDVDNYVRFEEYERGQRVQLTRIPIQHTQLYPPFSRTETVDATVQQVFTENRSIDEYEYDVLVDGEDIETHVTDASRLRLKSPCILFTNSDDIVTKFASGEMAYLELLSLTPNKNPVVLFGTQMLTILQGYSPSSKTLWEYIEFQNKTIDGFETIPTIISQVNGKNLSLPVFPISIGTLRQYKPLFYVASLFCDQVFYKDVVCSNDEHVCSDHDDDNESYYVCSREIGRRKIDKTRLIKWCIVVLMWILFFFHILVVRTILFFFTKLPLSYISINVLRHVDTPTSSVKDVAFVSFRTYVPFLIFDEFAQTMWDSELLKPHQWEAIEDLKWFCFGSYFPTLLWLFFTVMHVWRERILVERKRHEDAVAQLKQKARIEEEEKKKKETLSSSSSSADVLFSKATCRICFGGVEDENELGRLISPCMCKGSMRYVHRHCLDQWRTTSTNKKSFYECDQCKYRYSFHRTLVASVLRTSLLLHILALVGVTIVVLFASYLVLVLEMIYFKFLSSNGDNVLLEDEEEDHDHHLNLEYFVETELLILLDNNLNLPLMYLPGLKLPHLVLGFALCGLTGFFYSSIGFIPFFIGGNNRTRVGGIVFVVLIGIIRMFMSTYSLFKKWSGRVLESAENIVLEVGDPYEYEEDASEDSLVDETKTNETKDVAEDINDDESSCSDSSSEEEEEEEKKK